MSTKTKRTELIYRGERKYNIIHSRMSCSQLNSNLYKLGVVESPSCSCGAGRETVHHFFYECNKYVILRNELQCKITTFGTFNLKTDLFGIEESEITKTKRGHIQGRSQVSETVWKI